MSDDIDDETASQSGDGFSAYHPSPTEVHPPISPASPAESLFLFGLQTSNISASALAQEIRRNYRTGYSAQSVATDDFATAVESADDIEDPDSYSFFGRDVLLTHSREPILEDSLEEDEEYHNSSNMATTTKTTTASPTTEKNLDPAMHVYDGAKGVWAWGKGLPIVSPFLGITEAVAGKVVGVVGTSLPDIDGKIKPKLADLDGKLLNPAISAVVGVILGALDKTGDIIRPVVHTFLKPFGLIKDKAENPEVTSKGIH
jgi:hypothetical protein